uniref:Eukaryotic translation initiation factor 3 30 kDa subunit n=1 Tax=Panagrolaimus sp. JU765 TaxID=591449 RepID=A0AC34R0L5_9BILA
MSDWDDDDFDPTSNVDKSKVVDLGLTLNKKEEVPAEKTTEKKANRTAELEALEASKQSDLEAGLALMGLSSSSGGKPLEKKFESLKSRKQFEEFGIDQGTLFRTRSKDANFTAFAFPVIKALCADMTKLQLEEVQTIVQEYINVINKKEQEVKKNEDAKKMEKEKKKKKKQLAEEDMVVDDYVDYEDQYYA